MTKDDIVKNIWEKLDLTKSESAEVFEHLKECIKEILATNKKLKIGGFGVFEIKERKPRMGRNPRTGEAAEIKAGKTIKFRPGKTLREAVNKNN